MCARSQTKTLKMVMDDKKKKQKVRQSQVADLSIPKMKSKKKKQKLSKSQEIASPSLTEIDVPRPIDLKEAMKKQSDVAMFLTGKVISTVARHSNYVFSPASINVALTMVAASTEEEKLKSFIFSFLQSSSIDELKAVFREVTSVVLADGSLSGGPKIAAVNGVWMEKSLSFSPSSKDLLVNFFKADFAEVNFKSKAEQVRMEVNRWASNHTNGLIKEILPPLSVTSDTLWIYGNAMYFKGVWEKSFTKSMTNKRPFHLLNSKSVRVSFMSSYRSQYITAYDGFKVLKLCYQQGRDDTNHEFSMYFYLPDKKDGLDNLLERVTSTPGFLDSHIPQCKVAVGEFRIPKFKFEFGFEASSVFDEVDLKVSLYQKALIEIDEKGTEVVVVTACVGQRVGLCRRPMIKPKKIDFVADHPFLFLIREDKTGTVLFAGQIFDPSKSSST